MKNIFFSALILIIHNEGCAYETPTHAFMMKRAFDNSVLGQTNSGLYFRLGFDRLITARPFDMQLSLSCTIDSAPNQDSYADALPNWLTGVSVPPDTASVRFRCPNIYEKRDMPLIYSGRVLNSSSLVSSQILLGPTPELRFEGWLMRGVIREDDVALSSYPTPQDAPDLDPFGANIDRPLYHFYNPYKNTPDVIGASGPALAWGLGEADPFLSSGQQLPDPTRGNHFSYLDARRAYFLAMTYKQVGTSTFNKSRLDSDVRMALWGTTLKSIGHVVHLLQDQASPQHSRGERHNYVCRGFKSVANEDIATRTYENYTNYRLTYGYNIALGFERYIATNSCEEGAWNDMFRAGSDRTDMSPTPITAWNANYPIPKFAVQRKFFTTRSPSDPVVVPLSVLNARAGLGDYANRGFYTQNNQQGTLPSPPAASDPSFESGEQAVFNIPGVGNVRRRVLFWRVPDAINPDFLDAGIIGFKAPIVTRSLLFEIGFALPLGWNGPQTVLSLQNYDQMADMLIPRAVAYTAGMINFFFRGELEVTPNAQRLFGVVDLGQPHSVNADGYPIKTSTGGILGFEKVRLKVRNISASIVESVTNRTVNQIATSGQLVAIARYHRNPCYKPNLTGERHTGYVVPPLLVGPITEPLCSTSGVAGGTRTSYQEISVSAPLPITSAADLPGGAVVNPEAVDKTFDFSADPIPVNATDLFIQVVYRGQLGEETDGIAVGAIDVQEPTFYTAWNNTDHYISTLNSAWFVQNGSVPRRGVDSLTLCAGAPSRVIYTYGPANGPALSPFVAQINPEAVRLALMLGKLSTPTSQFAVRSIPQMFPPPSAILRSVGMLGQQRQASRELFNAADPLPTPIRCQGNPPADGSTFWCFDPVQRRRGQNMGDGAQPIFYSTGSANLSDPDVDAPPALPLFPAVVVVNGGANRFDLDSTPVNCPIVPPPSPEKRLIELREEAAELGIDLDKVEL